MKKFSPDKHLKECSNLNVNSVRMKRAVSSKVLRRVQTYSQSMLTPIRGESLNHATSTHINTIQNINHQKVKSFSEISDASAHSSHKKRAEKLKFKVKPQFIIQAKLTKQQKLTRKMQTVLGKVKELVESIDLFVNDICQNFEDILQQLSTIFTVNTKQFIIRLKQRQQKNIVEQFKMQKMSEVKRLRVESSIESTKTAKIQEQNAVKKINELFSLDFSNINQPPTKIQHEKAIKKVNKFEGRQVQTERNVSKKFQFDAPSRVERKLEVFKSTLNKIKRISFQGSILKL